VNLLVYSVYVVAVRYIEKALESDPGNTGYRNSLEVLRVESAP